MIGKILIEDANGKCEWVGVTEYVSYLIHIEHNLPYIHNN